MTKKAMILLANDPEMKKYGFRLLLAVHDELIGEVKEEFAEEGKERLSYLMRIAAQPECNVTMKCDALIFPGNGSNSRWYADVYYPEVKEHYEKILKSTESKYDSFNKLKEEYPEFDDDELNYIISNNW